jgi:hypothetical protein
MDLSSSGGPVLKPSEPGPPPVTFYTLRPGAHQPAFRLGERYRFLREDVVAGYIFLELHGRATCVWAEDFEASEAGE